MFSTASSSASAVAVRHLLLRRPLPPAPALRLRLPSPTVPSSSSPSSSPVFFLPATHFSCCCPAARKPDCTTAKTGISGSIWKRDNHTGDDDANGGRTTPLLNMAYSVEQHGSLYKDDYRLYFKKADGTPISPMHDIPL